MAAWDVTVNGVSLSTLAFQVDVISNRRQLPLRKDMDIEVQGLHGEVAVVGTLMPTQFSMRVWIDGTDAAGQIPSGASFDGLLEANLEELLAAFDSNKLIDIRIEMPDATIRRCFAKVTAFSEGENGTGRFHMYGLKIPGVHWESLAMVTDTISSLNTFLTLTNLTAAGSKATPLTDFYGRIDGPITNPRVDNEDGGFVTFLGTVPAGSSWVFDSKTWRSRLGIGITMPTEGSSIFGATQYAGSNSYLLELPRPYRLKLNGTGTAASTKLVVTARPKFN